MKNKAEEYNSTLFDQIFESISPQEEKRIKFKMLLSAKIEEAMKAKGWNRTKLLKATGQRNASVATKWFSGTHNFTFDTLFDIQEALGIKLLNTNEKTEDVVVKYHVIVQSTPTIFKNDNLEKERMGKNISSHSQINSFNSSMITPEA